MKHGLGFGILVIVIYLEFGIWNLLLMACGFFSILERVRVNCEMKK